MPAGQQKGETLYRWNGKSATGAAVSAGLYYYKTASGEYSGQTRPVIPDESRPLSNERWVGKNSFFLY